MKQVKGWWFPDADEFMAGEIQEDGTYQGSHLTAALKYVKNFRLAIDGGAHVGTWSRILSQKFERVLAFEPSPDTACALAANMVSFECRNVQIISKAISDRPGRIRMTLEGHNDAIQSKNTGARYMAPDGDIEAITIDGMELGMLDFFKLDVEGAEYKAFIGAKETLRRCKPVILFEDKRKCQQRFNVKRRMIYGLLESYGFRHVERAGCDEIWLPA